MIQLETMQQKYSKNKSSNSKILFVVLYFINEVLCSGRKLRVALLTSHPFFNNFSSFSRELLCMCVTMTLSMCSTIISVRRKVDRGGGKSMICYITKGGGQD